MNRILKYWLILALFAGLVSPSRPAAAHQSGELPPRAAEQVAELLNLSVQETPYLEKLDSHLLDLVAAQLSQQDVAQVAARDNLRLVAGQPGEHVDAAEQRVQVDIYLTQPSEEAVPLLEAAGLQITAQAADFGVLEGSLPVGKVLEAASLPAVKAIVPVTRYEPDVVAPETPAAGAYNSEGDAVHRGPQARTLGATGGGVRVGVISDSMNQVGSGVAGSQASGDLPANVKVLSDHSGQSDEGRAMAEIIYDTAPGVAGFYFASGTASGAVGKANAINSLVNSGVHIIADDIYYLDQPFFQDGPVAQAVDNAYAAGVAYFASAGNRARQSYESTFRPVSNWHDFDPGTGTDTLQTLATIPSGGYVYLVLQWDEAWGAAVTDYDIYLYNTANGLTLTSATSNNPSSGLPMETLYWYNNTYSSVTVGLGILRYSGSHNRFLKYIYRGFTTQPEWGTSSDAINPDAASARGSVAVAAIYWNDSGANDPESYSSRGPKTRLFDKYGVRLASPEVRQKPQVAGADGVYTSVPNFQPFYGTSAATPSVAGVAALVKSTYFSLAPAGLYAILTNPQNTIDCNAAGNPDNDCGYGFVLADRAAASAFNIVLPTSHAVSFAGPAGSPQQILVHIRKPATGLSSSAMSVHIGGLAAAINQMTEYPNQYVLLVTPPTQAASGLYSIQVTVNATVGGAPRTFTQSYSSAVQYNSTLTANRRIYLPIGRLQ
jgi:hypothetical protein